MKMHDTTVEIKNSLIVFMTKVLRKIYVPKWEEVEGDWRKLCNEELHDLYLAGIVQIIKIMRMRWAGNVARMGKEKYDQVFGAGSYRKEYIWKMQ